MEVTLLELRRITRATHASKVCRVLAQAGVPYKLDGDGAPIVLRAALEKVFGLTAVTATQGEIDMGARLARLKEATGGTQTAKRKRAAA
jgi:hypothetical protein